MPSRDPPVPLDAQAFFPPGGVNVTFSHSLEPGFLDTSNWFVRWMGLDRAVVTARVFAIAPTIVNLDLGIPVADPGPDIVSYTPPPFDVVSDTFKPTPADAFTNFPIHA